MTEAAIVKAFRDASDSFVSGESLASIIGVSRAAIWKHIKNLQEKGFEIEALPRLGYRLVSKPDRLTSDMISPLLTTKTFGNNILHFDSLGSTNAEAKTLALKGVDEGAVVIAEEQFGGKGRLDRVWVSPKTPDNARKCTSSYHNVCCCGRQSYRIA
jgi:BirA family biotin operon repressor/biotin-[acetyl-CoA-carboxylase] ligase